MMRLDRQYLPHVGLLVAVVGFVIAVAFIRASHPREPAPPMAKEKAAPKAAPTEARSPKVAGETATLAHRPDAPPEKQAAALHDSTLLGMIQNAKVAQEKGNTATRDAMVKGLKKEPQRAKELIQKEISRTKTSSASAALVRILEMLQ
jgi:hypothetical protein